MIRQLGILTLLIVLTKGKPVSYDQRQNGDLNLHAKLNNIMIVIATPATKAPSNLLSDLASQILELKSIASRNKKVSVEDEEIAEEGRDPFNVKIVRIEDNDGVQEIVSQSQGQESSILPGEHRGEKITLKEISNREIKDKDIHNLFNESQEKQEKSGILKNNEKLPTKDDLRRGLIVENMEIAGLVEGNNKSQKKEKIILSYGEGLFPENSGTEEIIILEKKPAKVENKETDSSKIQETSQNLNKKTIQFIDEKSQKTETQGSISTIIQERQTHPKKLENQKGINQDHKKSEIEKKNENILEASSRVIENKLNKDQKIEIKIEDKIASTIKRAEKGLRLSLDDRTNAKNRMSLKKELPRIEDVKEEEIIGEKNEVRLISDRISQLKPIGDMIENCGPGRIRNRYGVCQFDESFN